MRILSAQMSTPIPFPTPAPRLNRVRVKAHEIGAGCMDHVATREFFGVHLAIGLLIGRGQNYCTYALSMSDDILDASPLNDSEESGSNDSPRPRFLPLNGGYCHRELA